MKVFVVTIEGCESRDVVQGVFRDKEDAIIRYQNCFTVLADETTIDGKEPVDSNGHTCQQTLDADFAYFYDGVYLELSERWLE